MLHMKDKLFPKPELSDFKALVLHHAVVLVLLTHSCRGSVSSPDIGFSIVSNGVLLECKSGSWYPEPEVFWLDGEGNLLSAGPTETVRGPDDLYTVSSRMTVEKSNSFTCRVQQNNINQTRETRIHVPDDVFMVQASPAVRIIICLAVCFMSVAVVVFVMWKWGQNKADKTEQKAAITRFHDVELQLLMEGQRDREQTLTEEMKHVDMKMAKLDEALERNEEELQHVQQVITTLMDQKKDLKNQREKLSSLLQEVKTQLEVIKKKLTEKSKLDKDKKKSKREKINKDLKRRKAEHDELLQNIDKLLETTEGMIIRMTEGKVKLEKDKEQINKQLKDTKKQREEIQRELELQSEKKEEKHDQLSKDAE